MRVGLGPAIVPFGPPCPNGHSEELDGPFLTEDGPFYFVTEDGEYFQQEAA